MNLPYKIVGDENDELQMQYAANGNLLNRTYIVNNIIKYKRDYISNFEYKNDTISNIYFSDGRIINENTTFIYEYNIKDHLGNVRVTFTDFDNDNIISNSEITSRNDYYAFGLKHENPWRPNVALSNENRMGYNGKENVTDMNLNYLTFEKRVIDPIIGRFGSVDPISYDYPHVNGYNYAENSPMVNIDLHGLQKLDVRQGVQTLVMIIQGYAPARDPVKDKTQEQNYTGGNVDIDGISYIQEASRNSPQIQVGVYHSDIGENTKRDVSETIKSFRKQNPDGKVVMAGHSMGADNSIELLNENKDIKVDLLITLDIADYSVDTDVPSNVSTAINVHISGGNKISIIPSKTRGVNIESKNSTHRSIDNDLYNMVSKLCFQVDGCYKPSELIKTAVEEVRQIQKKK